MKKGKGTRLREVVWYPHTPMGGRFYSCGRNVILIAELFILLPKSHDRVRRGIDTGRTQVVHVVYVYMRSVIMLLGYISDFGFMKYSSIPDTNGVMHIYCLLF